MLFHHNVPVDSRPGLASATIAALELPVYPMLPTYPIAPVTDIVPSSVMLIPLPILTPPNVLVVAVVNTN